MPWKSARVLSPSIRRNIKLAECPSFGQTIFDYAPFCPGALDYKALADKIIAEWDEVLARRGGDSAAATRPQPTAAPTVATATPVTAPIAITETKTAPEASAPVVRTRGKTKSAAKTEAGA